MVKNCSSICSLLGQPMPWGCSTMANCRPRLYCASSSAFQLRNSVSGFSRPVPSWGTAGRTGRRNDSSRGSVRIARRLANPPPSNAARRRPSRCRNSRSLLDQEIDVWALTAPPANLSEGRGSENQPAGRWPATLVRISVVRSEPRLLLVAGEQAHILVLETVRGDLVARLTQSAIVSAWISAITAGTAKVALSRGGAALPRAPPDRHACRNRHPASPGPGA